ncbi:MAG: DUF5615 family PIN-like protein [Planctomycetota bacterium]
MRPLDFPLLADENIHPEVVRALVEQGKNVRTVREEDLLGRDDLEVIRRAHVQGRLVLTHDADFGRLAVQAGEPYTGIVYLRPGHMSAAFVLGILAAVETVGDVSVPFIVVAERRHDTVRLRLRSGVDG